MSLEVMCRDDLLGRFASHSFAETAIGDDMTLVEFKDGAEAVVDHATQMDSEDAYLKIRERLVGRVDTVLFKLTTAQRVALTSVADGTALIDTDLNRVVTYQNAVWKIRPTTASLASSGAMTVDASGGDHQYGVITGNVTSVTVSNLPGAGVAQCLHVVLEQGGAGGFTLPGGAWTGVDWWKPIAGVPEMPPVAGQTLLIKIYINGDIPIAIGDWHNNE